jgi:hypothetical protein
MGCFGQRDEDFVSCAGAENPILRAESNLFHYNEMMDYFDTCRLFDRPMFDYNTIRHFLFNLRDKFDQPTRRLWSEKKFTLYQKFTLDHRHCGLYVKLALLNLEECVVPEEKGILIPAESPKPELLPNQSPTSLRLIRGRG